MKFKEWLHWWKLHLQGKHIEARSYALSQNEELKLQKERNKQ